MIKRWGHSCWVPEGQFWRLMLLKSRGRALNSLSCWVSLLNMHAWGLKQMNVHYLLLRVKQFWDSSEGQVSGRPVGCRDKNTRGLAHHWGIQDKQDTRTANLWLHHYFACVFFISVYSRLCFRKLLFDFSHSPAWQVKQAVVSVISLTMKWVGEPVGVVSETKHI